MLRTSYTGRFSGRTFPKARVLGHGEYIPTGAKRVLRNAVLDVYRSHSVPLFGPLGPRGCGYRLEGRTIGGRLVVKGSEVAGGKGHAARLRAHFGCDVWTFVDIQEMVLRLRRSGDLPWESVDDGRTEVREDARTDDLAALIKGAAMGYEADLLADQEWAIELWIEASGGFGFWTSVAFAWGIPVYSGSGMNAVPKEAAERIRLNAAAGKRTLMVFVTDWDPAGLVIADRFVADVEAFLDDSGLVPEDIVQWTRLGLDEAQIDRLGISRGGPKRSHGWAWSQTAEAEAWTSTNPADAKATFDALVESVLDLDQIAETRRLFEDKRHQILADLDS